MKDLYVDGDIDKEEYRERRALLEEDVARVTDERSRLDDLDREMERIEHLRAALLSVESPFSGHYAFLGTSTWTPQSSTTYPTGPGARRRMELYRGVGLRVRVGQDVEISLAIAGVPVREIDRALHRTRSPTQTP